MPEALVTRAEVAVENRMSSNDLLNPHIELI
jgi:hypothetical protein